tara:strand:- start:1506 stop:2783 length:1278 start_codon:yes stop_codon:yes gene_type:complete
LSPARRNFFANIVSLIIKTGFTIILVPFYISILGNDLYSDWIILYSLPAFFELTNFGVNQAVNTTFSLNYNKGNKNSFKIINHGIIFTLSMWSLAMISISFLWDLLSVSTVIGIDIISESDSKIIMLLLTSKIFIEMIRGSLSSYFFAYNINHYAIYFYVSQYILECLIIIFALSFALSLKTLSFFLVVPSIIVCLIIIIYNVYYYNYIFNLSLKRKYLDLLLKPSFSFSILTFSEYILNQCFLILIKRQFDNESVVIYNTSKTLTNYIKNIQGQFATSVVPVFNFYYGKKLIKEFKNIFSKTNLYTIITSIFLCFSILIFIEQIWNLWLNNSIGLNKQLIFNLVLVQFIGGFWIVSSHLIMSINKHFKLSIYFVVSSIATIIVYYFLSNQYNISLAYLPFFFLIHHFTMLVFSVYSARNIIKSL